MKQYMVLVSLIALGVFIFNLVAGQGDDSILNALGDFFRGEIERMSS